MGCINFSGSLELIACSLSLQVVAVGPGATTKDGKTLPMSVKVSSVDILAHASSGCLSEPLPLPPSLGPAQVGDRVLLPEYGGHTVKLGEVDEFHLYRDEDILGKFQ